jgi:molybdopterin/thiamine biosynthesis adenylyltransferase/nitroreductase
VIPRYIPSPRPPWPEVMAVAEREAWYPLIYDRTIERDRDELEELLISGQATYVFDTIAVQIGDLMKTRNPQRMVFPQPELDEAVEKHLAGRTLKDYGRWIFFPWSRRLVHMLPPVEFFELRSDRNRHKITRAEQLRLAKLRIGLVGLSVGNAVAVTLALEGLFGELRLADFDELDLSNMNRIRCAVHDIGVNKAVICARQIFEQNPYAKVAVFTDGFTRENLTPFFDEGGRLNIVIDECDSLWAKLRIREEARARKLPVLMETSDRGLLDIERYDLEPDRPVLHGLLGGLTSEDVDKMPPPMRVGLVLRVVGQDTMSPRAAASMLELGRSVRAFSQLGSDVTLGGATTSIAVRRLGLDLPMNSGRVYIDVSKALADAKPPPLPRDVGDRALDREHAFIREVVGAGVLAPSMGNTQPWKFVYERGTLQVHSSTRGLPVSEADRPWAWVAIGCALENMQLTAHARGHAMEIELFGQPKQPDLVASLKFLQMKGPPESDPLLDQIPRRVTNRKMTGRTNLSSMHLQVLAEAARSRDAKLQFCTDPAALDELALLLGEADRRFCLAPGLHAEFFAEYRWTPEEVRRGDGLDITALDLSPMDMAVLQIARSPDVAEVLRLTDGGEALAGRAIGAIRSAAAVAYLTMPGQSSTTWVRGGRALQQVWLTATALGLAVQPCNNLLRLLGRVERFNGQGLKANEMSAVIDLRDRVGRFFVSSLGDADIAVLRISHADPPTERSRRLPLEAVLTIAGSTRE